MNVLDALGIYVAPTGRLRVAAVKADHTKDYKAQIIGLHSSGVEIPLWESGFIFETDWEALEMGQKVRNAIASDSSLFLFRILLGAASSFEEQEQICWKLHETSFQIKGL